MAERGAFRERLFQFSRLVFSTLSSESTPSTPSPSHRRRIVLFANTDWFLYNFKRSLAEALRATGDEVILLSPPGEYGQKLKDLGFRWEPFPMSRSGISPLEELSVLERLRALYEKWRPDVVHHFTIKCVIYGSLAARAEGIRGIVNSVTGLGFVILATTPKARLIRPPVLLLYRLALRGTQTIFLNQDNLLTLKRLGVLPDEGTHLIAGDGIDTRLFFPKPAAKAKPPIVLMMARLLQSKGLADLVEAARRVHAEMPEVIFQVAGELDPGNPESVTPDQLRSWRARGDVIFLGHRSDALELNQAARVVVLPSTQGEGIPRSLLEGAACAVPMVATDVPGCRDVVRHGITGLLVPISSPLELAQALLRLLRDDALCERMGQAAREHVEAHFSDDMVIAQTCEVYRQALATS